MSDSDGQNTPGTPNEPGGQGNTSGRGGASAAGGGRFGRRPPGPPRPGGPGGPGGRGAARRRPGPLTTTVVVLAIVVGVAVVGSDWWTEILWYDSVGYSGVLWTKLGTQVALFVGGAAVVALLVASSLAIAYRSRPVYAPSTPAQNALDRYRELIEPLRRLAGVVAPLLFGLFAGVAAASQWRTALLWLHRQPFGKVDDTFGHDIGFYVFTLPWLGFLVSFLTMALVLALVAAAVTHYVYGGLALGGKGPRTTRAARIHLSILAALLVLVRGAGYWLERYELTVHNSQRITGLTYTDQVAVLPTKAILAVAAVICALLFLATIWTSSWRLPVIGVSMLVILSLVVGGMYPLAVQKLKVDASAQELEKAFIEKNIVATREAYGISDIARTDYRATTTASSGQLRSDAATVPGIRVLDPLIVSKTFTQMQGLWPYYRFPDVLDVDRYSIDGQTQDSVVAARELDLGNVSQRNWVNDHTVYTHGYGLVAAKGNKPTDEGTPDFFVRDLPPKGSLGQFEPRIYFGEHSPDYSIVGAPPGGEARELDYQSGDNEQGEKKVTYAGIGGVRLDNPIKRTAYAIADRDLKILLAEQVGDYSRILDHRTPRERVERVAPWLTLDGNIYPSVVDGRIQWIVDGYTTSSNYPYSRLQSLEGATTDAVTSRSDSVQQVRGSGQVNYIRNSVKATVDAYDGTVRLYSWDDSDPVLKAWSEAFGNTVLPMSSISGQLMAHLRYPEDLFKVQRELLTKYHITDPNAFFSGGEFWKVPVDPTTAAGADQPPYYLSIQMPGTKNPSFSLTTAFSPGGDNRPYLTGFLAVDSDAGSTAGKRSAGYGKMRLLDLPGSTNVPGPSQVQNTINASNATSEDFKVTLNNYLNISQTGSQVQRGNLLTLPVGGGLLYVQPIYVSGGQGSGYPLLQAVVVSFGAKIAWAKTLDKALDQLFDGNSGAQAGDSANKKPGTTPTPSNTTKPTLTAADAAKLAAAIEQIRTQYAAAQDAMKKGDWDAYGQAQKALGDAIRTATALQPEGGSAPAAPSGSATPSPSATPSGTATPSGSATPAPSASNAG